MRYLPVLLWIALLVYCLIDVVQSDEARVRTLPRSVWFLVVIVAPFAGAIAWFVWGRPAGSANGGRSSSGARRRGPTAPDDDPEFLAALARANARRERERRQREQRHDEPHEPQ
jgi:hypothetical protein